MTIPPAVVGIIKTIEQQGFEAYIVGGCVRDMLYGCTPHDWDLCTNANPEQIKACFPPDTQCLETGIQHGTITIVIDHTPYEVTSYRIDGAYTDHRHPNEVRFVEDLKEDLSRRDFTMNAMAYHPQRGLVDYYNGREDLNGKRIRCVGVPNLRLQEDALRILRALRFAATYAFDIAADTQEALHQNRDLLRRISAERVHVELCKLLCGTGVAPILYDYADIICILMPELKAMIGFEQNNPYHDLDVWQHTVKSVSVVANDPMLRLTMLFHDIAKPLCYTEDETHTGHFYDHAKKSATMAEEILKRLRFDKETISRVKELIVYHGTPLVCNSKFIKRWLHKIGAVRLRELIAVQRADTMAQSPHAQAERLHQLDAVSLMMDEIIAQEQCFSLKNLAVNGSDLIKMGIPQGKQIGVTLDRLMNMVIEDEVANEKNALLSAISLE